MTPMEPSIRGLAASSESSLSSDSEVLAVAAMNEAPVPRPDEPNVFNIPTLLHATYQPLPLLLRTILGAASLFIAFVSTWDKRLTWMHLLLAIKNRKVNVTKILAFLGKALLVYSAIHLPLQDRISPPSRITTAKLQENYWLPSRLSKYSNGVHFLQYDHDHQEAPTKFQAMHLNHGFGASSLSWLPVIPKLAERLHIRQIIAHDAPGFGFTDRNDYLSNYTNGASCDIGIQLLLNNNSKRANENDNDKPLLLMGHSMGALTTLLMVLKLPETTKVLIILVAPALRSKFNERVLSPDTMAKRGLFDPVMEYVLKRVVGWKPFWKNMLRGVWGDWKRVSDSDALRFQWPSIGKGWEQGLLRFAQAQMKCTVDERAIFQQVLDRPNTKLFVLRGSKDCVVTQKYLDTFFVHPFNVTIDILEGQGHDPFEEDVELFLSKVEGYAASFAA